MNYLAHLFLAQPNADSHFGNLLGDFGGNKQVKQQPIAVQKALANHYLVDKFTDNHPVVKSANNFFSTKHQTLALTHKPL